MATIKISLAHPVKIGESTYDTVTLRELTPGDIIEASLESERAMLTEDGYQLLASSTLMGVNTLLRQIESIGDFKGPMTVKMLNAFHREDFELIQLEVEALDGAVMEAVKQRGRDDASDADDCATDN